MVKTPSEAKGTFDYIICAHKAIGQDAVPAILAPAVEEKKTTIVIIQNGVGNEEPFRKAFPDLAIITCVVSCTCNIAINEITKYLMHSRHGLVLSRLHRA